MNKYIAFLRGINISGKNKISMSELKKGFEIQVKVINIKNISNYAALATLEYVIMNNSG